MNGENFVFMLRKEGKFFNKMRVIFEKKIWFFGIYRRNIIYHILLTEK